MNSGAILVGVAMLVLVGVYVTRPLFEKTSWKGNGQSFNPRARLIARRDAVYALIRELDADFQTGQVNEYDYQAQRERYVAEGVALLKQLDELPSADHPAGLDAEIEAAVSAMRHKLPIPPSPNLPIYPPKGRTNLPTTRFCTQCGQPADPQDKFCGRCGAALKEATVQ